MQAWISFFLLAPSAPAATLQVGTNQAYTSISAALAAASNGDRIEVDTGTYVETLDIDSNIHLVSVSGAGGTGIRGTGNVITISPFTEVTIEGFTLSTTGSNDRGIDIRNATATLENIYISGFSRSREGGAIRIRDGAEVTIENSNFDGNESGDDGGHIYVSGSTLVVNNSDFTDGVAEDGGGIYATDSVVELTNVLLDGNATNGVGGSLVALDGSVVSISGADLYASEASGGYGGHIYAEDSTLTITGSNVEFGATAYLGGGIYAGNTTLTVDNTTFYDNVLLGGGWYGGSGGGVSVEDSTVTIAGSLFSGNSCPDNGGALFSEDSSVSVSSSTFTQNEVTESDGYGGAICADGGSLDVTGSNLSNNTSGYLGGAFRTEGGASLSISNSTVSGNQASNYGGAIHHGSNGDLVIENSIFSNNSSDIGGAIRWRPDSSSATAQIENTVCSGNEASGVGGCIAAQSGGSLEFLDNEIYENSAPVGGAIYADDVEDLVARRNLFCLNAATDGDGGAARLSEISGADHSWTNNLLVENSATGNGGGLAFDDETTGRSASVVNNNFVGNSADGDGGAINGGPGEFINNIVAWTVSGAGVYADVALPNFDYEDFYDNSPSNLNGAHSDIGTNSLETDPLLTAYWRDAICSNDNQILMFTSPLLDAGDPTILDPDGSNSDIGAYGGEYADPDLFVDADNDGWIVMWDCDDNEPLAFPTNTEVPYDGIDNDCVDGDACDLDGDGFEFSACGGADCDDDNAAINPDAAEVCDGGIDNNCNGASDDADSGLDTSSASLFYADADGDGFGDISDSGTYLCEIASGYATEQTDCDDSSVSVNPSALEVCDGGIDNNCNGAADDNDSSLDSDSTPRWYADTDEDGYGDELIWVQACLQPAGHVGEDVGEFDCDDHNAAYHPYAEESDCTDPNDYNCDGSVGYADSDGDGWAACAECDDAQANTNPDATETWYDGVDSDCDGASDYDADGDGYDAIQWGGDDCNDSSTDFNPGVEEIPYDELDQDCDGTDLLDVDGDGFDGEEGGGDDCDDEDPGVNPGADDLDADGTDQDCDGTDGPQDTGIPQDTGSPDDTETDDLSGDGVKAGGCGCSSQNRRLGFSPFLLALLLPLRRRKS